MRLPLSWVVGRTVAAVVLLLAVNSCDTPLETETNGVDRVVVTPTSGSVEVGATLTLNALVLDESGNALRDRKVVWSSQNPAIATVSQSGVVQGVAAGTVNVAASSGGKSASAAITVTARPVTLVRVTPGSATIAVGASTTLQAEALDASGARVLGKTVFWTSSSDAIAVVSANGVVAGISPGSVTISATVDSRTGTAAITVSPQPVASVVISPRADTISVGERVTLQATPLDARGLPLTGRIIVWTSLNPAVATVSSVGEVLGLAVGNARIRATVEGRTAEASLDVRPVPVSQVVVTPAQVTLAPGQTSQLTVTLSDSAGNVLSGRTVTYASNNVAVATVSSSGLITAVAEGAAQIVVTSEGKTASALVTVTPVPVASISITPNQASLRVSQRVALTAQAFDAQGRPLANRRFTWLTGAPSVATVNQQGEVTAVGLGTASVFAATEGISAGATITVTNIPVSSVQVTPSALSLQQGGSAPLLAVTRDSAGSALSGRVVTWSSSNEAVAVVSSLGRVTAVAAGSAVITATSEGVSGTCNVTVSNVPVASVTVTPANPTLGVGQALGMTATMRDGGGTILSGRPVTWASSNTAVATITAAGLVTAVASGTTTISAVSEGVTGMTLLTVSAVPVARVEVLPTTVSLNPNQTSQLTATAYDANNNVLVRPITWTSNATGVATVSGSGLVTAVATGSATISATSGGVTGTAIVTVTLVPVASVTVTPSAPNMFPGNTLQLAATARDAGGNIITGRPTSWLSSNTAVATVSSAGLVTAVTQGAATITATIDGVSGNATVTINQTRVASVTLTPTSSAIYQGQQVSFTAVARDSAGNVLARPITWTSTNVTIVGVNDNGLATGVNPGTATVIATVVGGGAGGTNVADSSGVSVALVPVASMTISPKPVSIFVSQQQQLTVQLLDSAGGTLSASGRTITWGSLNPAVASVNASGLVSGLAQGSTRVGVSTPGSSGTVTDSVNVTVNTSPIASVTVQPKPNSVYQGQTKSLRAVIVDGFGTVVRGRNVSWQSRNTGVVTVSQVAATPDSATFTGVAAGTTYIVAIDPSGLRDSTQVTASLVPVASVQVTPSAQSLQLPDSVTLAAQPKDSAGGNLTRTITWVSLNPSIASVASTGQMTGKVNTLSSGSATIQARTNGAGAGGTDVVTTAAITVTAVVHTVQLTAPRNFIVKNDTMHSSVVLRDTLNNVLTGKPITYSSLPSNVASVAANGVVTGGPVLGSVTITATSEGKSGSVAVSGIGGIASITSACTSASCASTSDTTLTLSPANSQTYTITVRDSAGGALSGRTLTVTTGSSAVASLSVTSVVTNGSGQATVDVTPMSAGSTTITFFAQPREGAIPPGTPGSNNPTKAITIVVQ